MSVFSTTLGQFVGFFADRQVVFKNSNFIYAIQLLPRFQRRFKILLCLLLFLSTISYLWFSLSIYGYGSQNSLNLFVTFCAGNVMISSSFPIFYEAVVEQTYPIAEGTMNNFIMSITHVM